MIYTTIEVLKGRAGKWYLRLVGRNGKIVCHSENYHHKGNAVRQAKRLLYGGLRLKVQDGK